MLRKNAFSSWGPPGVKAVGETFAARSALVEWRRAIDEHGTRVVAEDHPEVLQAFVDAHGRSVFAVGHWVGGCIVDAPKNDWSRQAFYQCLRLLVDANDYVYVGRTARAHVRSSAVMLGARTEDMGDGLYEFALPKLAAIAESNGTLDAKDMRNLAAVAAQEGRVDRDDYERLLEAHFTVTGLNWNRWY